MIEKINNSTPEGEQSQYEKIIEELRDALVDKEIQLREIRKEIVEIIPEEKNFKIELQESELGVDIKLKHTEEDKEINLNKFLPPEHFFDKDKEFVYKGKEKRVGFPENELEFRGFLLGLFHEIGHANEKIEYTITTWDTLKALWEGISKLIKSISIQKELREEGNNIKTTYKATSLTADSVIPNWYIDKRAQYEAKSERGAWAYSLRSLRKLKQEGYDVFAGFENVSQIQAYVAYCLYTYDAALFMKKLVSGNIIGEELNKLNESPVFWKKVKKYNKVYIPGNNE